ncbi:lytic transglycosylase domain-containing protein [Streptomyces sp. NPDC004539]|uniref:lytic transglycosylase domain-containing protein n=1 Tax=Streptomyces sp. NPDC004539 TaxID=3154280 RepID=UPI0033AF0CA4
MSAQFGRRLRKSAVNTTVAAVAVAALAASQAPEVVAGTSQDRPSTDTPAAATDEGSTASGATGNSPYYTDLPPLNSPNPAPTSGTALIPGTGTAGTTASESGIPATVLDAYKRAASTLAVDKPGCNLPWELLAAIGKVESGHASGGNVAADGTTITPILGPPLNGVGFAHISDTDGGAYDGDSTYDRAVGPMQFIPSTWAWAGRDGNGDGKKDPNNVYDAALAAAHYLCRNSWDMSTSSGLRSAILSYNNSTAYYNTVTSWLEYYRRGTHEVPDGTGTLPGNRSDNGGTTTTVPPRTSTPPKTPTPPATPPKTPPKPPTTPPSTETPTDTVRRLEDAGTGTLTATAGTAFAEKIATRAETADGKAVAKVRVRFLIVGDTDATFTGGEKFAAVTTDAKGVAMAPALQAGEDTGTFTVRAILIGRAVDPVDYQATVTARSADLLSNLLGTLLSTTAGGEFADQVQVKATYKGAVAGKVAATATLVAAAGDTTANDKGPYFKDADGKTVRTLTGLVTDANGVLKLPKLYADDTAGTFLLKITTTGGATLTVELTVTAVPTTTPDPEPSEPAAASPSPSGSAEASASTGSAGASPSAS